MAKFTSFKALARHQDARAKKIAVRAQRLHTDMVEDLNREAQDLSSGRVSTRTLRRMGHPFGRRMGSKSNLKTRRTTWARQRGKLPTLPINVQSGLLRRSWIIRRTPRRGFGQRWDMRNRAPYSKYVLSPGGTSKMVTRPLWRVLKQSWRKHNRQLIKKLRALHKSV
ncbi:MAG: hypothetical protein BGO01_03660 [Armatimonadetes bacterium 55-13]|nr:hypothetical protein [Armatimonadota bacterium]OJU63044.1 MAG: hypothetical protein BGO01_03660 [Armatimonadetes bacterium 55-13]